MLIVLALVAAHGAFQDASIAPAEPAPASDGVVNPASATPAQRSTSSTVVGRRMDPKKRAERTCTYGSMGGLSCSKDMMEHFNIVEVVDVDAPEGLIVTARLVPLAGNDCDVGVQVAMSHKTKGLVVEWATSTMDVDRRAVPLLPGFARRATAALTQRTSTAAADTILEEIVVADAPDGTCLVKLEKVAPATVLRIRLSVSLDGAADTVTVVDSLKWEPIDEVGLFTALGEQPIIPAPERPMTATLLGAGLGAAVAVPVSVGMGIAVGRGVGVGEGVLAGLGLAAIYGVICVGPCAGAGYLFVDNPAHEKAKVVEEEIGRAEAIRAKRVELGIEPAKKKARKKPSAAD